MNIRGSVLIVGNHAETLAVVRSLGAAGFRVIVGVQHDNGIETRSRYCHEIWKHPNLTDQAFSEELVDFLKRRSGIVCVLPVGVDAVACLAKTGLPIPVAGVSCEVFEACSDKIKAQNLAETTGIRAPYSRVVTSLDELEQATRGIGFPVIIKAVREGPIHGRKAFLLLQESDLLSHFQTWPQGHEQLIVQEYLTGPVAACDFVAHLGDVVAYYESDVPRTDMPDGSGVAVEFLSRIPRTALFEVVQAFTKALDYSGPGCLQCIELENGEMVFLENNPRFSAGVGESIPAGVDIPRITVEAALGQPPGKLEKASDASYLFGRRVHWLERDLTGLIARRRELKGAEIVSWLRMTFLAWIRADGHMNWRWKDPAPALGMLRRLAGRLSARFSDHR